MFPVLARIALGSCLLIGMVCGASSQNKNGVWDELDKLHWRFAGFGNVGQQGTIGIPKGYGFLGSTDARRFLELQGNPPRDNHYVIAPTNLSWFGLFQFEATGYVRDDEKIDPDDLLETLKESNRNGQQERKRLGLPVLYLEGWYVAPHYDIQTKRLEWGTKLRTERNEIQVNYLIKILGRKGVMDAMLVSDPQSLDSDVKEFKALLSGYSFNNGENYAEFRSGDKIAEYGLTALIVGGAAAAAAKSGAFKGIVKFVGIGVLAALGAVWGAAKSLFRRA